MKKKEIVKNKIIFNEIIRNNECHANKYFVIYRMAKETKEKQSEKPNFGIAVSTKFGNAVIRNKYKRIVRLLVDQNKYLFPNNYNYIIMIRKDTKDKSYIFLNQQFVNLLIKREEA